MSKIRCCGRHEKKGKYCRDCPKLEGLDKKRRKKKKERAKRHAREE